MASGQVGRLSVRVLPDTTRFREDLKKALERAERGLSVSIEATVELAQGTLQKVKAQLEGLEAEIPATIDAKGLKPRVEAILHSIDADLPVGVDPSERFQAELEALRQSVEQIDAEVPVVPHISNTFRLRTRLMHLTRPRLVNVAVTLNKASYTRVATALAALSGGRAFNDISKQVRRVTKNLDRFAGVLGVVLPLVGSLSALLIGAGGAFLTLGGSVLSIIPGLLALPGILTGSLIGIGIMVAALWDFSKVLEDLGPKYDHLQNLISDNFWAKAEAPIRNLAEKALPMLEDGLGSTATALGTFFASLSDTLASQGNLDLLDESFGYLSEAITIASEGIKPFTNAIIELGTVGMSYMPGLAKSFNEMALSFDNWVSKNTESGQMFEWIDTAIFNVQELGRVIVGASGVLGAFHMAASNAGGPTLTSLADGLESVNTALRGPAWQGALTTVFLGASQAIDALGPGVRALGDAFIDMAPTIGQILVLSGQLVSDGFEALATVFEQPAFQGGLLNFFEGLLAGSGALQDAMPGLGDTLGAIFTTLGDLAEVIGPVLGAAFDALGPVMQDLMSVISVLAPVLGEVLVGAIELLAPYIQDITSWIADWVAQNPELSATLLAVVAAVGVLIAGAVSLVSGISLLVGSFLSVVSFAGTMGLSLGGLAAVLGKIVGVAALVVAGVATLVGGFVAAWNSSEQFRNTVMGLGESIGQLVQNLIGFLVPAFQSVGQGIMNLVTGIASGLAPFIQGVVELFAALWGIIQPIAMFLLSILGPALAVVGELFMGLMGILGTLIGGVLTALGQALSVIADLLTGDFKGAWDGFVALLSGLGGMLESIVQQLFMVGVNLVKGLWEGILSAADGLITLVTGWVQGLVDTVKALFGIHSPSTVFMAMGVDLILGLIQGIVSMLGALINAAVSLGTQLLTSIIGFVTNIANGIRTGFNNARTWAVTAISNLVSGVVSFFSNLVGRIVSFVSNIASSVRSGFDRARTAAVTAISTLVSRVVSFFSNLVGRIVSFVSNIASSVRSGFNNARSAAVSAISNLVSSVVSFFGNLFSSISSRVSSIRSTIQSGFNAAKQIAISAFQALVSGVVGKIGQLLGHVRALPGKIKSGLGNLGSLLRGAGKDLMQGMINGIKSMAGNLVGAAKGVVGDAVAGAKNLLGIASPSKVFMKIGQQTGEGMVIGLERQTHAVTSAMRSMVQPPALPDVNSGDVQGRRPEVGNTTNLYVQPPESQDAGVWGRRLQESLDLQALASAAGGY